MSARLCGIAALLLFIPFTARADLNCAQVLKALGADLADATCFQSTGGAPRRRQHEVIAWTRIV